MTADRWNAMTVDERRKLVRSLDRTMKLAVWKPLVERMAASEWEKLSGLQRAALATKEPK